MTNLQGHALVWKAAVPKADTATYVATLEHASRLFCWIGLCQEKLGNFAEASKAVARCFTYFKTQRNTPLQSHFEKEDALHFDSFRVFI